MTDDVARLRLAVDALGGQAKTRACLLAYGVELPRRTLQDWYHGRRHSSAIGILAVALELHIGQQRHKR